MKNVFLITIILLFVLVTCHAGFSGTGTTLQDSISITRLFQHLHILAADSMAGRSPGTPGGDKAATYLAQQFFQLQLTPGGENKSYYQYIQMHSSTPTSASELMFVSDSLSHRFTLRDDYVLNKYGAQTLVPKPVELIFAGYGIFAPEFDYNDYQSIDVKDKIAVYISGEPWSNDISYFAGAEPTIYSYPESKERLAIARGARGSILIPNPREEIGKIWDDYINTYAFEDITLAYSATSHLSLIMNPPSATVLFHNAPYSLSNVFSMDKTNYIKSFPMNGSISFKGQFRQRDFIGSNIIGYIEGSDTKLKQSCVLVTAHYDHLGIGPAVKGDSVYNGAMDNAIGVSALLEIARVLKNKPLKRSVLFVLLTGEEKGLLGSTFYIDHPVFPLYKTIAAVNIDGMAMFDEFNDIVGVGAALSGLGDVLNKTAKNSGLTVSPIPQQFKQMESFASSDQISFAKAGIPSILIMDGLDYKHISSDEGYQLYTNWMKNIYHTPFDDLDQVINSKSVEQHCHVLLDFISVLVNSDSAPQWNPGVSFSNARLRTIAEKR